MHKIFFFLLLGSKVIALTGGKKIEMKTGADKYIGELTYQQQSEQRGMQSILRNQKRCIMAWGISWKN